MAPGSTAVAMGRFRCSVCQIKIAKVMYLSREFKYHLSKIIALNEKKKRSELYLGQGRWKRGARR